MGKQDPFEIPRHGTQYLTGKYVGAYISQHAASYLRLLAVYKSNTIQAVLHEIIEDWMANQEPVDSIIETLADRVHTEWRRRKTPIFDWNQYEEEVIGRLKRRKVSEEMITQIVKEMRAKIGKDT